MNTNQTAKVRLMTLIPGYEATGMPSVVVAKVGGGWDSSKAVLKALEGKKDLKVSPKLATITGSYEASTISDRAWARLQLVCDSKQVLDLTKSTN